MSASRRLKYALASGGVVAVCLAVAGGVYGVRVDDGHGSTASGAAATENTPFATVDSGSATVDPSAIPLGDGKVSTSPKAGYVDSCTTNFRGGGARHAGAWIDDANGTWNSIAKVAVEGTITWPTAGNSISVDGDERVLSTNDVPKGFTTGVFPIARSDPAYAFDTNPNHISAQTITFHVPLNPVAAAAPSCTGLGPIGVMTDGVLLYNALDDAGRDAVAHETQDSCDGHPDGRDRYHYHDVSSCILQSVQGDSVLVGYALDGYGIYVERDASGNLPVNADLDACHGRTSPVMWNGTITTIYHYDATIEYPYTVGCFHGTPVLPQR